MDEPGGRAGVSRDERGVSHVLGVVLVVAIVLAGVVSIVGFGVTGLSDSTSDISDTTVERDLAGLAEAIDSATVHSDTAAGTTTVDLALAGVADSREWIRVDGRAGQLTLLARENGTERELASTPLGLVEYESPRSPARVAYQSGMVFSAPDAGGTPAVVRSGEVTHRVDSAGVPALSLHVTRLTGLETLDRQVEVSVTGTRDLHPEVATGADELVVRVDSAYSGGWRLALREALPADRTTLTHNGDSLEAVYDVPPDGAFLHAYRHEVALGGR